MYVQPASGNDSFRFSVSLFSVVKSYPRQRRIGLNIALPQTRKNAFESRAMFLQIVHPVFTGQDSRVGQRIMVEDESEEN